MANQDFDDDEVKVLITAGVLAAGALIGTYIVLKAIGSYKEGQVITENETANIKPNIQTEIRSSSNYRYGTCSECGDTDVALCNRYSGNTSLPYNHCFTCGDGLHYESLGMCLECAKWDSADDD